MNIAIYSAPFFPTIGGVEQTTASLAEVLRNLRYSPVIFTTTPLGVAVEQQEFPINRSLGFFNLVAAFRRFDLIICKGGVSARAGLAALLTKRPLIIVHEMSGPYWPPTIVGRILGKIICRYAKLHVAVSKSCLESKLLPKNTPAIVIYNPVNLNLMSETANRTNLLPERHYDLLFVGRLTEGKGVLLLMQALSVFESKQIQLSVAIVGEGECETILKKACANWQSVQVVFAGPLTGLDLANFYHSAKAVVMPSTKPEGMGLVAAEALSFGRPVIGSDQAAIIEVVGAAGLFFRNGHVEDLCEKISSLLKDENYYHALSDSAMEQAKQFSLGCYEKNIEEVLFSVFKTLANKTNNV